MWGAARNRLLSDDKNDVEKPFLDVVGAGQCSGCHHMSIRSSEASGPALRPAVAACRHHSVASSGAIRLEASLQDIYGVSVCIQWMSCRTVGRGCYQAAEDRTQRLVGCYGGRVSHFGDDQPLATNSGAIPPSISYTFPSVMNTHHY